MRDIFSFEVTLSGSYQKFCITQFSKIFGLFCYKKYIFLKKFQSSQNLFRHKITWEKAKSWKNQPASYCSYTTRGFIENFLPMVFREQKKHSVCFGYHKETDSQLYEKCFDQEITKIFLPAQQSANGTMTNVPEVSMLIVEGTIVLKLAMQRKAR